MTSARSMLHPEYRATRSRVVGCVIGYISIRNTTVYYFHFILHLNLVHDVHCVPPYTEIYITFTGYGISIQPGQCSPVTRTCSISHPIHRTHRTHRLVIGYTSSNRKIYYFHFPPLCIKICGTLSGGESLGQDEFQV
jgi:hypothetical protein